MTEEKPKNIQEIIEKYVETEYRNPKIVGWIHLDDIKDLIQTRIEELRLEQSKKIKSDFEDEDDKKDYFSQNKGKLIILNELLGKETE